jgi:AraC-like DNA-binding protein
VGSSSRRDDAYEQWLRFISRHLYHYRLTPGSSKASNFAINARCRSYAGFTVARFTTTGGRCQLNRAAADIATDGHDRYALYLTLSGDLEFSQFGRTRVCAPTSFTVLSASEPAAHNKMGDNDTLCFLMPREFVDQRIVHIERTCVQPISSRGATGFLACQSLLALQHGAASMEDPQFLTTASLVGDLVLLALSGSRDCLSGERSVRLANIARVKKVIRARLHEPDLTLDAIAAACSLSLNYVHKLFRDEGCTVSEYLKNERLQRARQMLESPAEFGTTVTQVSLACGFSNMSHFSTAFRRAFCLSPREVLRRRKPPTY